MSLTWALSKLIVILCINITLVNCQCILKFPENREKAPRYEISIAKHTIGIPYTDQPAYIEQGDNFTAYCATKFERFETNKYYHDADSSLELYCNGDEIYHSAEDSRMLTKVLSCVDLKWSVYEPVSSFSWCSADSLVLASKGLANEIVLAAACIDVMEKSMRSLNFVIGPNIQTEDHNALNFLEPFDLNTSSIDKEVKKITMLSKHFPIQDNMNRFEFWTSLANYRYQSIVQGVPYTKIFSKYDTLLDTIWWPNLAAGNWKRFMEALDERSKKFVYIIFMGTSGIVKIPYKNKCTQQNLPELQIGDKNTTVPAYIWTYVEDMESNEDFVFVGYNSPLYDFFPEEEIIFCDDICKEVTWLEDIRSTFRYSTMGVTFCCSTEAVRSANSLEGFPVAVEPTPTTYNSKESVGGIDDSASLNEIED